MFVKVHIGVATHFPKVCLQREDCTGSGVVLFNLQSYYNIGQFHPDMMSGKCKTSPDGTAVKKQRKDIDLDIKIKRIKEYDGGKKVQSIANIYGFSHSTVSTIVKDQSENDSSKGSIKFNLNLD